MVGASGSKARASKSLAYHARALELLELRKTNLAAKPSSSDIRQRSTGPAVLRPLMGPLVENSCPDGKMFEMTPLPLHSRKKLDEF